MTRQFKPRPDRPDLFWQEWPFLTYDPPLVSGSAFRGGCGKLDSWHDMPSNPPSKPMHQHRAGRGIVSSLAKAVLGRRPTAPALQVHLAALSPIRLLSATLLRSPVACFSPTIRTTCSLALMVCAAKKLNASPVEFQFCPDAEAIWHRR